MLDPEARIAPRQFALKALVDPDDDPDSDVAVCVDAILPSGFVCLARAIVEVFLFGDEDSIIVRAADVSLGKSRSALRDGAVADLFHATDTHPLVAEARLHAGFEHLVDVRRIDHAVDPGHQFTRHMGVLVRPQVVGCTLSVGRGSDAGLREHGGYQLDGLPVVVPAVGAKGWYHLGERLGRAFQQASRQAP